MLESDGGPKPLLIAGGAGRAGMDDEEFGSGNEEQAAVGNKKVGTSGKQKFIVGDKKDVYCAGAGYKKAPRVSDLAKGCVAPKSYKEGLTGGKGVWESKERVEGRYEGGFGGGGAFYTREIDGKSEKHYYGAGGGFTGGSTRVDGNSCHGGGGGSFSADPKAWFGCDYVEFGYCKIKRCK